MRRRTHHGVNLGGNAGGFPVVNVDAPAEYRTAFAQVSAVALELDAGIPALQRSAKRSTATSDPPVMLLYRPMVLPSKVVSLGALAT